MTRDPCRSQVDVDGELAPFSGPLMLVPHPQRIDARCVVLTAPEHTKRYLRRHEYGLSGREAARALAEQGRVVAPRGPAGSVVFFDCNAMRGSVGNLSPWSGVDRFIVFSSGHNRFVVPFGAFRPSPRASRRGSRWAQRNVSQGARDA